MRVQRVRRDALGMRRVPERSPGLMPIVIQLAGPNATPVVGQRERRTRETGADLAQVALRCSKVVEGYVGIEMMRGVFHDVM